MHSFDEIAKAPMYRDAVREHGKVGTLSVGVLEMQFSPQLIEGLPAQYAGLAMINSATRIKHRYPGCERATQDFLPGDMILRPPNLAYESQVYDSLDVTLLALETEVVQSATTAFNADVGEVFSRLDARPFRSPLIEGLGKKLSESARTGRDRLYADALAFALIHEVWRLAEGSVDAREAKPGALGGHTLRRVDEAIDAACGAQLTLDALADLSGMSMTAFSAAMKAATGQTPYQYVLGRRVAKARDMVETGSLPLAEVAYRCGFSSQSHMTDVFRAKLGATPGKLRSARH